MSRARCTRGRAGLAYARSLIAAVVATLLTVVVAHAQPFPTLDPDAVVSDTIDTLGAVDRYTFTLATPERVVLQATGAAGVIDPCVRVLTTIGGSPVTGGSACSIIARIDLVLAAGTYFVEVSDNFNNHTGPYTLLYQTVVLSSAVPLVADTPVASSISPLGDLDLHTFTLATSERVVLQATGAAGVLDPCIRVRTSISSPPVVGGTACSITARLDLVLAAGTYFVEVSDNFNNQTGPYTLLHQTVVLSSAVPLAPDVSVAASIAPIGDLDLYTFTQGADGRVVVEVAGAPGVLDPCLRVLTSLGGPPVTGGTSCGITARVDLMLAAGTYVVEVADHFNNHSGPYSIVYQPNLGSPTPTPLMLNAPRAIAIGAGDSLAFDIDVPGGTTNLFVRLEKDTTWAGGLTLSFAGAPVATATGFMDHILHVPAPAAGTYRLLITRSGSGGGTGTGTLTASTSLPSLTLGQPTIGTMRRQWGNAWYQVDVPPGQPQLSFDVEMLGLASRLDVWAGRIGGTPRWSASGDRITLRIPSQAGGRYYVQLFDSGTILGAGQARDHRILADVLGSSLPPCTAPTITGVSPTKAGTGPVTVEITGACLATNASMHLQASASGAIVQPSGTQVTNDGRTATASFDLSGAQPGEYLVLLTQSGSPIAAPEPLIVSNSRVPGLWVDLVGRRVIRPGRPVTYLFAYGNNGDVDIPAPLFVLSTSSGGLTLAEARNDAAPRLHVFGSGGPSGILSPGSRGTFEMVVVPPTTPGNFTIVCGLPNLANRPFDWNRLLTTVPPGETAAGWAARVALARSRIGESWDDVLAALRSAAREAEHPEALQHADGFLLYLIAIYGSNASDFGMVDASAARITTGRAGLPLARADIEPSEVQVRGVGTLLPNPSRSYVLIHGLGGIRPGDDIHQRAAELKARFPDANVFIADWTPGARRAIGPVPLPWLAARHINDAGRGVADRLEDYKGQGVFDPGKATFIMHSFGNYVGYVAARELGGVDAGLGLNTASTFGGYRPPAGFASVFTRSVQVVTESIFDTITAIADRLVLAETPYTDLIAQHNYGLTDFLRELIAAGNTTWLNVTTLMPNAPDGSFDAVRRADGSLGPPRPVPLNEAGVTVPDVTTLLSVDLSMVFSVSPEDKYGPTGFDDRGWVAAGRPLSYRIDFWNKEDAPAATQDVIVTDQLDADLDPTTFAFTEIGFLRWKVPIDPTQYFNVHVDLRPDFDLVVNVEGTFDPDTGQIEWRFRSLDPITLEPTDDPFAGFLPPITSTGYEIGWVAFSVSPRAGLSTGTEITNQSFVKFDVDVFKPAPPGGPFLNTLDATPPVSSMLALPAVQNVTGFRVHWEGSDEGAGIRDYTISVSTNGAPFVIWQPNTTASSAVFPGERGVQYAFHVVARDHTGNTEAAKTIAEASTSVAADALLDTDLDGMTDDWETQYGLDPRSDVGDDGTDGDPDGDGMSNGDEYAASTDPTLPNLVTLAEGATGSFFAERIALANPGLVDASVTVTYLQPAAAPIERIYEVPARQRLTIVVNDVPGLESADVSAVVRATRGGVAVERTMTWDRAGAYGGHTGRAVPAPRTQWYLAEGEANFFDTFVLFTNANADAAFVTATYLLEDGSTIARTYVVNAHARLTVRTNDDPALAGRPFSTSVTSSLPIIVDRAMYFSAPGQPYAGGHASPAVHQPSSAWFVAEGATGEFFDEFLLLANPNATPVTATVRYLTEAATPVIRVYDLPPTSRTTIYVDGIPGLEQVAGVSAAIDASAPIVVERAMYWPRFPWYEAHSSAGVTATGTRWVLAEGETGGALEHATYLLLANPGARDAAVTMTFLRHGGAPLSTTFTVPAHTRVTRAAHEFALEPGEQFGVLVESSVPIAVERAMYWNGGGVFWGAGTNETATRLR